MRKIYDRKRFISGVGELVLAAAGVVTIALTGFDLKLLVLTAALLLIGAGSIASSLSKEDTRRQKIEERDERSSLVKLKAKALSSDILSWVLFLAAAGSMIGYGVTGMQAYVFLLIGTGVPLGIYWIGHIAALFYYERHI